ncbi:MAG TPA: hypothetical protein VHG08_29285 [Longimicrobium sp.]|nr:hypothetical protein [Longimicrobium sp.]
MAEYFDSEAAAVDAIKRWHARDGTVPEFFAKILLFGNTKWMVDLRLRDHRSGDFQIVEELTHTLQTILSPAAEAAEAGLASHPGSLNPREFVHRPDLACSNCGNASIRYGSHLRCCRCNRARLCEECQARFRRNSVYGCPTCGYHEDWDDVFFELKEVPSGVPDATRDPGEHQPTGDTPSAVASGGNAPRKAWWRFWKREM